MNTYIQDYIRKLEDEVKKLGGDVDDIRDGEIMEETCEDCGKTFVFDGDDEGCDLRGNGYIQSCYGCDEGNCCEDCGITYWCEECREEYPNGVRVDMRGGTGSTHGKAEEEEEDYVFDCYVCGKRYYDDGKDRHEVETDEDEGGRCKTCPKKIAAEKN